MYYDNSYQQQTFIIYRAQENTHHRYQHNLLYHPSGYFHKFMISIVGGNIQDEL